MKASRVKQMILAIALVACSCSTSRAIDPTTGQFVFKIVPIEMNGMVVGYTYTLDPNDVFEVIGDIEYNLPADGDRRLEQFTRGESTMGGFENLRGVQDFEIQNTFVEQTNFIRNVHASTSTLPQSGDIFEVKFDLVAPFPTGSPPGPAPLVRFFSNPASTSHIINFDVEPDCIEFDVVSSGPSNCLTSIPEPTACSLLLLGAVCFGLRIRRGQRGTQQRSGRQPLAERTIAGTNG